MPGPTRTTVAISLKMYFSAARALEYCEQLRTIATADEGIRSGATELVVLPSFVSIPAAISALQGTAVHVGAQDLAAEDRGAFTGEVSGRELAEIGCTHVEVGHAERRTLFGENDEIVAAKTTAAFRNGLVPVLCVGESSAGDPAVAAEVCISQVLSALPSDVEDLAHRRVIVAYEPYWAIGAAQPAPADYVAAVCRHIRAAIADRLEDCAIVYGGSAGPGLLTALGSAVDGLFLGRFAHDPQAVRGVLAEASLHAASPI